MRLFASLSPSEHAAEHLDLAVRSVAASVPSPHRGRPDLRWVPFEQRHITMAFYGHVPEGAVEDLAEDLASACADVAPFDIRVRGAGVFSGRTLWAGIQPAETNAAAAADIVAGHNASGPLDLMRRCEEAGGRAVRQPESVLERQRRRAHLTLARVRDRRRGEEQLRTIAEALAVYEGPPWTVTELQLVDSKLGQGKSGGPLYTTLAEFRLAGRGSGGREGRILGAFMPRQA